MDRLYVHKLLPTKPALRWLLLTLGMSVSSYLVANAIPFFTDLVSFIGAMTSIPLTLLLPAILYRRAFDFPVLWPDCTFSFALLLFSTIFMGVGLVGSIGEIDLDWESNGPPFSCD
jgi:amino acid permease